MTEQANTLRATTVKMEQTKSSTSYEHKWNENGHVQTLLGVTAANLTWPSYQTLNCFGHYFMCEIPSYYRNCAGGGGFLESPLCLYRWYRSGGEGIML